MHRGIPAHLPSQISSVEVRSRFKNKRTPIIERTRHSCNLRAAFRSAAIAAACVSLSSCYAYVDLRRVTIAKISNTSEPETSRVSYAVVAYISRSDVARLTRDKIHT